MRTFRDPEGREWNVWAVLPSRRADDFLPDSMAAGWLCFETADEKRRLHPIAEGWEEIPDAELTSLCGDAEPVTRRTTTPDSGDAP